MRALGSLTFTASLAALSSGLATEAGADSLPDPGLFAPAGINLGYATHPGRSDSGVVGVEASLVWFDGFWVGGYVDALYEPANGRTRLGIGPEIGFSIFGLDFGAVADLGGSETLWGYAIRGMLTIGYAAIYARYVNVSGDPDESGFGELGVLVKWPLRIIRRPRPVEPTPPRAGHGEWAARLTGPHRFVLVNRFMDPICSVKIAPNGSQRRGTSWLEPGETIQPGGSREFGVAPGRYDLVLGDCSQPSSGVLREYSDIRVEADRTFHARSGADEQGLPPPPVVR
ncbi:MAG: hypothetical protein HYY06_04910 [Deltaproteobacteria bacterium]|nr:hypothetical protein [Deltaproteobacteria bacterium]